MRTLPTKLSGVIVALTVLACLPPAALVRAEERDAKLRREALRLNEITGKNAVEGEAKSLLTDKAHAKKLIAEAARMAGEKPQPFTYNATLILGSIANALKDYTAADTFYRLHMDQAKQLRSAKGVMAAYMGLIRSAYNRRKYAQVEKLCDLATEDKTVRLAVENLQLDKDGDEDRKAIITFLFDMVEDRAIAIAQQGELKRAIDSIESRFRDQSDSLFALHLKAKIYRLGRKNQEALKVYEDEIERIKSNNDMKKKEQEALLDEVRYFMSNLYIETGEVEKAAGLLKALLTKDPKNPTYNNDLGYVWADHGMNLAEAEKLIRKALEEDRKQRQEANPKSKPEEIKDRGAYLDSLGWVLFKQKKYVEAKRYLRQAVQNSAEEPEGESIELYDHLGDVLLALGQKAEAVAAWKKGLEAVRESQRDEKRKEEVEKKIKANE